MPTYEFRCPSGHEFERFYRKISDGESSVECPECHAMAERKMSLGGGLLFRGSGFYITDYGKDGKKDQRDAAKATSDAASASATSSGGDSKAGGTAPSGGDAKGGGTPSSGGDAKPAAKESAPAPKAPAPAAPKPPKASGGE